MDMREKSMFFDKFSWNKRSTVLCLAGFLWCVGFLGVSQNAAQAQDIVELMNGSTIKGKMIEIRKAKKEFDFQSRFGKKEVTRTYSYRKVHAVTFNGKRFVLTKKTVDASTTDATTQRTKTEVLKLISEAGETPPDWFAKTPANHPKSLNLDWPLKVEGPWNESKNVGQYIWGRVNPNVSRWKSGIKLVHECLEKHQGDRKLMTRDMDKLGDMYFTLLQDYERAAYWLQKAGSPVTRPTGVFLAECYWRLGNKQMALDKLKGRSLHFSAIKLFGDMGEVNRALKLAQQYNRTNLHNEANLNAGDALRAAGKLEQATEYYQKILDRRQARNAEYLKRFVARASGSIEAIKLFDKADVSKVASGTYSASAVGYNGDLTVEVVIKDSKIKSVKVTQHREKQFYAALTDTPDQIIKKQGFTDIDGTSGATITSQAIVIATAKAMSKGVK